MRAIIPRTSRERRFVDLLPTLLEMAEIDAPDRVDGRSFAGLLTGETYGPRDRIYAQLAWYVNVSLWRAVRTRRYKYIENYLAKQLAVGASRSGRHEGG